MDDLKIKKKAKEDPNCDELVCKQTTLYNKYKSYISKDDRRDFSEEESQNQPHLECPLGKDVLGFYTWNYLHTMAAYYPELPNDDEKALMRNFIQSFAYFFPCRVCRKDLQNDVKKNPVKVNSNKEFVVWLCQRHNTVNLKLGKDIFDCSPENLKKRWKTGYEGCSETKYN